MLTYEALVIEIEETTALRRILTPESEIMAAVVDRERLSRADLALTPEHVNEQSQWRAFGVWVRARIAARVARKTPPVVVTDPRHDHLGMYFVSLPQDIA